MSTEFEIEEGRYYRQRNGLIRGPMVEIKPGRLFTDKEVEVGLARGWDRLGRRPNNANVDLVERVHVFTDAELEAVKVRAVNDMFKPAGTLGRFGLRELTAGIDDLSVAFDTEAGGTIVLAKWPEGFVLRYHGEIVWRSWVHEALGLAKHKACDAIHRIRAAMTDLEETL